MIQISATPNESCDSELPSHYGPIYLLSSEYTMRGLGSQWLSRRCNDDCRVYAYSWHWICGLAAD